MKEFINNNKANGRLTLKTWITSKVSLSNVLLLGLLTLPLFLNVASAAKLYDLKSSSSSLSPAVPNSYRLNFRYREETGVSQRLNREDEILVVKSFSRSELNDERNLEQYDAAIYYTLAESFPSLLSHQEWLSIDLGVNFKFIEQTYELESQQQSSFRTDYGAYPMFSASALFDLPLSGMTASVEGSYYNFQARELSEYRAIVTYQIDNVFGVTGGWEQQQYYLNTTDNQRFDKEGPFVDLFYRF